MRALEFKTGHVIYNLAYTYKFQLKTTKDCMMFEFTENTCRISKQVQKPMNKLNNNGTGLTKRTIFVNEGNGILLRTVPGDQGFILLR